MLQRGEDKWVMENRNGQHLPPSRRSERVGIPIPIQGSRKCTTSSASNFFSSSEDSSGSSRSTSPAADDFISFPTNQLAGIHSGSAQSIPLNVYGTSPRTSVMFNYYNSPKGSYAKQNPKLVRTRSTDTPEASWHHARIGFGHSEAQDKDRGQEAGGLAPPLRRDVPSAISPQQFSELDPRPRAWSESDKHRSGNASSLQSSRMSALRRLRMKFGQKGGLKRQKSIDDERNRSGTSIASLEKVEEGYQLSIKQPENTHNVEVDRLTQSPATSIHQEHESVKKSERRLKRTGLPQVLENPEAFLVYQRFLEEHTCYDLMPTSSKLVVLDTRLEVRKAFHAIIENSLRCAPLWDNEANAYVGMLTVSDFVNILLTYHNCPSKKLEDLENQRISCWRKILKSEKSLIHLPPNASLFDALRMLTKENIRRLAIVDPTHGDIFHVINHRRILHFLHLFMPELPKPAYMSKSVGDLSIGTYQDVAVVSETSPVIDALNLIANHKIFGLPVVDAQGRVTDIFTKTDILVLAEEQLFYDLKIKVKDVISLPTSVGVDENRPALVRTMPGSPALTRRRNDPKFAGNSSLIGHPNISKRSPLLSAPGHGMENGNTAHKTRDNNANIQCGKVNQGWMLLPHNHGQGDHTTPRTHQPQHRYRTISTEQITSPTGTHLVTVKEKDTLEAVINSIVLADVLQAVIVDDKNRVSGVISVGDILRFLVSPKAGHKIHQKDDEMGPTGDITPAVEKKCDKRASWGDQQQLSTGKSLASGSDGCNKHNTATKEANSLPHVQRNDRQWVSKVEASKPFLQDGLSQSRGEQFHHKGTGVRGKLPSVSVVDPQGEECKDLISLDEVTSAEILISGDGMKRH